MDAKLKKDLEITATKVRMGIIEGVYNAKAGHPGGSLSVADTLTYLYMHRMHVDPKNPTMEFSRKQHQSTATHAATTKFRQEIMKVYLLSRILNRKSKKVWGMKMIMNLHKKILKRLQK